MGWSLGTPRANSNLFNAEEDLGDEVKGKAKEHKIPC